MKGFVIAGTQSGVGKTTLATGLMAAFQKRGLHVQPFKVGPDFIDPAFHQKACAGTLSRNLDGWMLSRDINRGIFLKHASRADIAIVEGVMGLFDGAGGKSEAGSTAEMAKWLGLSVILVVDASALSRSAAALVKGFVEFDPNLKIAGVILNKVAGEVHYKWLCEAIESAVPIKVLGGFSKNKELHVPERHLGLHLPDEGQSFSKSYFSDLASQVEEQLDLDQLLLLSELQDSKVKISQAPKRDAPLRMAVARDQAFCFYYEENIDLLKEQGVEIVPFSPMKDRLPENIDGIYFGGGYPELHASRLSRNKVLLKEVKDFSDRGGFVYAECGGFMYLCTAIQLKSGDSFPMVGIFPFAAQMTSQCQLGYVKVMMRGCSLGEVRGHYFHYSKTSPETDCDLIYDVMTSSDRKFLEGYHLKNVIGSYMHLHFMSNPDFANHFVDRMKLFHNQNVRSGVLG